MFLCYSYFFQVYPNPVESQVTIEYWLANDANISVKLFNSIGELIGVLINTTQEAGTHNFTWQTTGLANGLYFYTFEIDGKPAGMKRMIISKQ